jgi:hypothetical protein
MTAFVRVSGPPNSNFLVGYPGISATLVSATHYHGRAPSAERASPLEGIGRFLAVVNTEIIR